jgi:very-short-patch-repair endonuclease
MQWWALAEAQDGVISAAQLRAGGRSSSAISRARQLGELSALTHGVYLVGGAPLTYRARLWAAVLATDGVLSCTSAGRLWGVVDDPEDQIHVALPRSRHATGGCGVVVHRRRRGVRFARTQAGLPLTSRRDTVLDLLGELDRESASRLADRALQRRWITRQDCELRLSEAPSARGNPQLRRLAGQLGDGAAAASERLLHRLLRRAGLKGWRPNYTLWADGDLVAVIDVAFPDRKLAIEIDGMAHHVDVDRFRRDRSRQNDLVALGWTVLRFTWADLVERPGYVIAIIRRFLG